MYTHRSGKPPAQCLSVRPVNASSANRHALSLQDNRSRYVIQKKQSSANTTPFRQKNAVVQLVGETGDFQGNKAGQASVSRHNDEIGSIYAQDAAERQLNRGSRIRLEHDHGPTVSHVSSYRRYIAEDAYHTIMQSVQHGETPAAASIRKKAALGNQSTALRAGQQAPPGTILIETSTLNGPSRHVSRGRIINMQAPLSNAQAAALHRIAAASDNARIALGLHPTDEQTSEHAREHNAHMRRVLMSPLFNGHRLQREAKARDKSDKIRVTAGRAVTTGISAALMGGATYTALAGLAIAGWPLGLAAGSAAVLGGIGGYLFGKKNIR